MSDNQVARDGATGEPVLGATGIPVAHILEWLADGGTPETLLNEYPELTPAHVSAALRFAARAVRREPAYSPGGQAPGMLREAQAEYEAMPDAATVLRMADEEHARLAYEVDLLDGIREGLRQIINGEGIPHEVAIARLKARYGG